MTTPQKAVPDGNGADEPRSVEGSTPENSDSYIGYNTGMTVPGPTLAHGPVLPPPESEPKTFAQCGYYVGVQKAFDDGSPRGLFNALESARKTAAHPASPALSVLSYEYPRFGVDQLALQQKYVLYGGYDPSVALHFSPMKYVAAGLTFERDLAKALAVKIADSTDRFSVYTIVSRPGQGKTIALAQVGSHLCALPGHITLWSFDTDISFAPEHDARSTLYGLFEIFRNLDQMPKRLNILVDNLSKRANAGALFDFYHYAKTFAEKEEVNITFVFTSSDENAAPATSADGIAELRLSSNELEGLFHELTSSEPLIVKTPYSSAAQLITDIPKARDFGDDVPSFVDFVIENTTPIQAFRRSWFSDLSSETAISRRVIATLAVPQVLDLPVPIRLMLASLDTDITGAIQSKSELLKLSPRICSVNEDWEGFALTSSYRAQMLLRHLGCLTSDFMFAELSRFFRTSLEYSVNNLSNWAAIEADYLRHILQRLTKREFYQPSDFVPEVELEIADKIFDEFGAQIVNALRRLDDPISYAKWAGTLSKLRLFNRSPEPDGEDNGVAAIVCSFCSQAARDGGAVVREDPKSLNTLFRASTRLLKFRRARLVSEAIYQIKSIVDDQAVVERLLVKEADSKTMDAEKRVNGLLLSYVRFQLLRTTDLKTRTKRRGRMFNLFLGIQMELGKRGMRLDAGNALECADCVLPQDAEDWKKIKTKAQYLDAARREIRAHTQSQATWARNVDSHITEFTKLYGPLEQHLLK